MACKNGRPKLSTDQDRQLFIESAGTCLLCQNSLFPASPGGRSIQVAERAHIIPHSPDGPRGEAGRADIAVDEPANLVLLCPTCHTTVDKAPDDYPVEMLIKQKRLRAEAVARIGGVVTFTSRAQARSAVVALLEANRASFEAYGPDAADGSLPTPEAASKWRAVVLDELVPRNKVILSIVEVNSELASEADRGAASLLRVHTSDLESKHRNEVLLAPSRRFPPRANDLFLDPDAE
jgi:5-methylcytosine-specific restriction endonuclease McrA